MKKRIAQRIMKDPERYHPHQRQKAETIMARRERKEAKKNG